MCQSQSWFSFIRKHHCNSEPLFSCRFQTFYEVILLFLSRPTSVHPFQHQQELDQVSTQVSFCFLCFPLHRHYNHPCFHLSAQKLCVALCTCNYDVHPDPHGLRRRGHHVVQPIMSFHTEGQGWIGTLGDRKRGFYLFYWNMDAFEQIIIDKMNTPVKIFYSLYKEFLSFLNSIQTLR